MFKTMTSFRVIVVSGPHRSGTTICAKMIAQDTGFEFYPEEAFGPDNVKAWQELVVSATSGVIQCPSMCYRLQLAGQYDDVAIVFVMRNLIDIEMSQRLVGWTFDGFYKNRYRAELAVYRQESGSLAQIKHEEWTSQKLMIKHPFEVEYEDLSDHPLWIPRAQRVDFGPRQTAL